MRLEDADGAMTDFSFTDMHENVPVAADAFVFTPPPGVAIVNGAKPI
jgi:outer membrane lipoprotein carrier protein